MKNKTIIYFLSTFILLLGCYVLNLSYSLFTQNLEVSNVVDSTVPILDASLETNTYSIPANSGEVVRLKINNTGNTNIRYGISIPTLSEGINAYLVEKSDNDIVGNIEASKNKEVLVYLENTTENESLITFKLDAEYETISYDAITFISNSNIDCLNKVKILNISVLDRAMDASITDENKTILNKNFIISPINKVSKEEDRYLITVDDDYGLSYVYRGNVIDNYVNFAGFTWRIVRINGDGSVRLILDGTLDKICVEYDESNNCTTYAGTTSAYNSIRNNNAYIGYMYGLTLTFDTELSNEDYEIDRCLVLENNLVTDKITDFSTKEECESNGGKWTENAYEATHSNVKDSTIKTHVDAFYEAYIESEANNKHYEKYLADTLFCNDKSIANSGYGTDNTSLGYGKNTTYYITDMLDTNNSSPTLKCAEGSEYNFSRLTSNLETENYLSNGVYINNDLKHPVSLLSADELELAGAGSSIENKTYYMHHSYDEGLSNKSWWLNSPNYFKNASNGYAVVWSAHPSGFSMYSNITTNISYGIRPVINLKLNTVVESGNGTKADPYIIKEIIETTQ